MKQNKDLENLRAEIRSLTGEIVELVDRRMDLVRRIGEIKSKLKIQVEDTNVEQEIRDHVFKIRNDSQTNRELVGRLLNLLISESKRFQVNTNQQSNSIDHMTVFSRAKELERTGKKIIHLEVGEPDYLPPVATKYALMKSYDTNHVKYTETQGIQPLRTAIAKQYQNKVSEDEIIITPGARFAIFSAISSLVTAGDEIIILEPAWPAYKQCAEYIGAKPIIIKTQLEHNWVPELEQIKNAISKNTKMLVLNYPNNPTGKILEEQSVVDIIDLAKEHKIILLSDEVYSGYAYSKFKSLIEYNYDEGLVVSSFSKNYAMTGYRIGYAISNKKNIKKMCKIQALAITSVAEPIQYAALSALKRNSLFYAKIMKKRIDFVKEKLELMPIDFYLPDGAMYFFVRVMKSMNVLTIIEKLLEMGVAVSPGVGFGSSYYNFVRISACQKMKVLREGLNIIESVISDK
jgi:aspartate aminotransferase